MFYFDLFYTLYLYLCLCGDELQHGIVHVEVLISSMRNVFVFICVCIFVYLFVLVFDFVWWWSGAWPCWNAEKRDEKNCIFVLLFVLVHFCICMYVFVRWWSWLLSMTLLRWREARRRRTFLVTNTSRDSSTIKQIHQINIVKRNYVYIKVYELSAWGNIISLKSTV